MGAYDDILGGGKQAGGAYDDILDDSKKPGIIDKIKGGLSTAKDYGLAVAAGAGEGVASTEAGVGTFIQAPAANTLAGITGAAALADRGITAASNYFSPGSAGLNQGIQDTARSVSQFAAEQRAANSDAGMIAKLGLNMQADGRERVKGIQAFNREYNPELVRQQQAMSQTEGFFGALEGIKDNPMAFTHMLSRSAPDMAVGAGVAKGVASGIAATGGSAARQVAGASTAGVIAESASSANQAREGVYQRVVEIPAAQLAASPRFNELLAATGDAGKAREILANELADQAPILAGAGTAAGSMLTNKLFGGDATARMIAGTEKTTGMAALKNAGQESFEEVAQGVPEDLVQHGAVVQADPTAKFDLGKTVAENAAAGLAMGGGGSAASYLKDNFGASAKQAQPATPQLPDTGPMSRSANVALENGAATAPEVNPASAPEQSAPAANMPMRDPFWRVTEIELLSEQRELTREEVGEYQQLVAQIESDEAGSEAALTPSDNAAAPDVSKNAEKMNTSGEPVQNMPENEQVAAPGGGSAQPVSQQGIAQAEAIDPFMAERTDKQLKNLSAPGQYPAARKAAVAEIARRAALAKSTNDTGGQTNATQVDAQGNVSIRASDPAKQSGAGYAIPNQESNDAGAAAPAGAAGAANGDVDAQPVTSIVSANGAAPTSRKEYIDGVRSLGESLSDGDVIFDPDTGAEKIVTKGTSKNGTEFIEFGDGENLFSFRRRNGGEWKSSGDVILSPTFEIRKAEPSSKLNQNDVADQPRAETVTAPAQAEASNQPKSTTQQSVIKPTRTGLAARDDLIGAIMRVTGNTGIDAGMAQTITGDKAGSANPKLRGLFLNGGTMDLGAVAELLRVQEDFDVRDGEHLSELIRNASAGDVAKSNARIEEDAAAEEEAKYKDYYLRRAEELGLKKIGGKRKLEHVVADVDAKEAEIAAKEKEINELEAREERAAIQASSIAANIYQEGSDLTEADLMQWLGQQIEYSQDEINEANSRTSEIESRRAEANAGYDSEGQAQGSSTEGAGVGEAQGRARGTAEELTLTGQTPAEVRQQERDRVAAEAEANRVAAQEEADKKAAEKQSLEDAIKAHAANPDNFQFGESAKDAAKPMGSLFDPPIIAKPNTAAPSEMNALKAEPAAVDAENTPDSAPVTFTREGDFWNYYGDRAKEIAKALDLVATTRNGQPTVGIADHQREQMGRALESAGIKVDFVGDKAPVANEESAPESPLFATAAIPVGAPLGEAEMNQIVGELTAGWKYDAARNVDVIDRIDLPFDVVEMAKKQNVPLNEIRGVAYKGHIYLVREHHITPEMVAETLFHEAYHIGRQSIMGLASSAFLNETWNRMGGLNGLMALAQKYGVAADIQEYVNSLRTSNMKPVEKHFVLVNELIAHAGQVIQEPGIGVRLNAILSRMKEALIAFFEKHGMGKVAEKLGLYRFSNIDLSRILKESFDAMVDGKTPDGNDISFMTAWHGSPHDHDKFDSSKIGTGEGAQAYGYGHYFASSKEVAEWYKNKLTIDEEFVDGDPLDSDKPMHLLAKILAQESQDVDSTRDALETLALPGGAKNVRVSATEALRLLNDGSRPVIEVAKPNGKLYQVELAPSENEYLDWDKPLSEQSDVVKAALTEKSHFIGEYLSDTLDIAKENGVDFNVSGDVLYKIVSDQYGSDEAASKYLHSIGIRGIRYLDGLSRGNGEGSHNYVIFSDDDVSITAKYNKADKDKLTAADKAIYGMAAEGKSATEVLKFIASASRNPFNRQVAKLLLKTGINPTITVGDGKGWKMNAGEGNKYAAAYNPATNTVALFRPAASERNMIHELIHAATLKALARKGNHAGNMRALYDFVKRTGKLKGMYGMADVDEFTAEAFSNPKFQTALKGVDVPKLGNSPTKNAWAWFIRNIRSILGLQVDSHDALSQALDIGLGVMRENMRLSASASKVDNHLAAVERSASNFDQARVAAKEFQGKPLTNVNSGMVAIVSRNNLDKMLSAKAVGKSETPATHSLAVANLDTLFENAIAGWSKPDDGGDRNIKAIHRFFTAMQTDNGPRLVKMTVKEFVSEIDGNRIYSVEAVELNEKSPAAQWVAASAESDGIDLTSTRSAGDVLNIANFVQQSNDGTRYNLIDDAKAKVDEITSPDSINTLIYNFQNKFIDLKNIKDRILKMGGQITDLNDAYLGEETYHSKVMKRGKDFLEGEMKQLLQQLHNNQIKKEDFEQYLHARHAPERNAEMAKRNPNQVMIDALRTQADADVKVLELQLQQATAQGLATKAIESALTKARAEKSKWHGAQAFQGTEDERNSLSGMSDAEAAQIMAAIPAGRRATMDSAAAKVDAINAKTLDIQLAAGLIDKATFDAIKRAYQFYVPLHRDEAHPDQSAHSIGQGFSVKGAGMQRATGSNEKVTNILGHIAMQREAQNTRAEKNSVVKRLYLMAVQNPLKDFWSIDKPPMIKTIDPRTGFVRSSVDPTYKNQPNVVMARIAGKDVAIVFNEHNPEAVRLAEALKNLDGQELDIVERSIGRVTRWIASVNTQYNPIFGLINFARDVQGAMFNLTTTELKDHKLATWKETFRLFKEITKSGFQLDKMNAADQALWNDFQNNGGATGYRDMFANPEERTKALEKELKALDGGPVAKKFSATAQWLSDYNESMENVVRLAAYKISLQNGMSKERAASLAKNLTVNFNRKGAKAQKLGAFYAFFNASIQGSTRLAQTLKGPAGRKIIAGGIALGVMQQMLGVMMMGGGDDDEWEKIPDFVKERSIVIPTSKDTYISIPMPLGFNVIPNIGRLFAEWAMGGSDKPTGAQLAKLVGVIVGGFNPVGGTDLVDAVTPTAADPMIALLRNKDWTGKPIYREDMASLDPTPGFTRTKDSATPWAKGLAYGVNWGSGGTDYQPGRFSWTPDQIDYVIGTVTGGAGRELGKLAQTLAAPFSAEELPMHKVPLFGRIIGSTDGVSGQSGKFYENIRTLNGLEREIKGRAEAGKDVGEFIDSEPRAGLVGLANASEKQVKALRKSQKILKSEGDNAGAKEMDGMIAEVMKGLNVEMRQAAR